MQDGVALERKTRVELIQIAQGLEIPKVSALRKDDIISLIRQHREDAAKKAKQQTTKEKPERKRPSDVVEVCGILDVMEDGFGFLRFENYRPSENDVYVSPTQIRRFNLKTGDEIRGDSRPSQEEGKYSPLLFVKSINGDTIENTFKRKSFEKLTPIYPKEKLTLDTGDKTRRLLGWSM